MKKKLILLQFFCFVSILFISVAYAAFNSELKITGDVSVLTDTTAPTCGEWKLRDSNLSYEDASNNNSFINPGTNTTWRNTSLTLSVDCNDNMSGAFGCTRGYYDAKTYNASIKTDDEVITVEIKDAYNNRTTCTLPIGGSNPYLDKQEPTITITKTEANKFTYSATDDVGITGYMVTTTNTKPEINDTKWLSSPSEVTIDNSEAKTYYVWAKDGVNISSQSISTFLLTKTQGTGTSLSLKYENSSGKELSTGYVLSGTKVYVSGSANTGYGSLVLKKDNTSITNQSTQTISAATTISSSASAKEYIATFSSSNLLYGLVDTDWIASPSVARYKIENGIVTFESYRNDGYLMTLGRVYLEANKKYRFSADADGTWGSQVEASLMLDGQYNTYYFMSALSMSNNGYFDFIPTVSGLYHLRLDVNNPGETYHFSNIRIEQIPLTKTLTYNSELGTLPTISRVGYTFNNWWTSEVNGTQISTMTKMPASNTTYYAHWTPNKYYVYYNPGQATGGWDAATYATQERTYPGATTLRTNSMTKSNTTANSYTVTYNQGTADGGWNATTYAVQTSKNTTTYTKDGWTTSSTAYNTKNYADGATYGANSTANLTLYPNFKTSVTNGGVTTKTNSMTKSNSAESNSYTLTFKQGTATSTAPSAITNKKYTSYTANGWTTTSGSTSRTYANNTATGALTGNVTLYPCFTQTVNQKAITLPASATKSNTNLGTVTFNYNGSGTAATISPAYTTYAFNGWYTASSGGTKLGNAGASYTPNASIDVYPQFTGTAHSATFPSPTRTGYTFAGWYDAASGGNKVTSYTGSSNTTLYAHWTANKYTVTFAPNGGTMNSSTSTTSYTQNYGTTITMNNPTKTGYEFMGWVSNQRTNITTAGYWTCTNTVDPLTGNRLEIINTDNHRLNGIACGTSVFATPTSLSGSYTPSSIASGTATTVNYSSSDPNPLSGISATSFHRNTRTSYTDAAYAPGPIQSFSYIHKDVNQVYVIVARFPSGWSINEAANTGSSTYKWLTSQAGTGTWQTYVFARQAGENDVYMNSGHFYIYNSNSSTNTTHPTFDVAYIQGYYTNRQSDTAGVNQFKIGATNETLTALWRAVDQTVKITPNNNHATFEVKATNLFDKNDMITANTKLVQRTSTAWNGRSYTAADSTHFVSAWIRVVPGATYKITGATEAGLVEWNSQGNKNNFYNQATHATTYSNNTNFTVPTTYINSSGNTENTTFTYMRFQGKTADINNIKLEMVDSASYTTTQTLHFPNNANVIVTSTPGTGYTTAITKSSGLGTLTTSGTGTITGTLTGVAGAATTTNIAITNTEKIYTITLDKQSGSGGTGTIYEKYNTGYYTDSAATTQMSTSANGITVPTRTGYTFGGYYTATNGGGTQYIDANGKLTSSASVTNFSAAGSLYAKWTANKYYVYYKQGQATGGWDAATYATQERTYPGATTLRTNSMTKSNTTANSYTVTYNQGTADGGWNATTYAVQTSKNTTTYTKDGWTTSSTAYNTKNYADGATYGANSTANLTLYPNFKTSVTNGGVTTKTNSMTKSNSAESNSYTLTFKQGTATSTAPSAITNKKYTSYTANGWTTTSGSTSRTYANNTATGALTGNVTLYPCFTQTVNQKAITLPASATKSNTNLGTVTFNYNGSGAANTTSTAYTTYAFNGWYTASSGGTKLGNASASYTPSASIDVYPQFTSTAHSATFPSPSRTGYQFAGWYTAASGGTKVTSYTGSSNITYYAHWTEKTATLAYNANGHGTAPASVTMKYTTAQNAASAISATNYRFDGWNTAANGSGTSYAAGAQVKAANVVPSATTLYAQWSYSATPTITLSDYNTFTYTGAGASAYYVSTSATAPEAGTAAASSTFALNTWTTATNTGNLTLASGQTYYVYIKDAATGGKVSINKATIAVRTVTRSQGAGTTLTTKYDSSSGTAFTAENVYVLNGSKVNVSGSLGTGYNTLVLKNGTTTISAGDQTITANTTLSSSATGNSYTVTFNYQNNIYDQDPYTWTLHGNTIIHNDYKYTNPFGVAVYSNTSNYTGLNIPINSDKKTNTNYRFSLYAKRAASISGNLRAYAETRDSSNNVIAWNHSININDSNSTLNTWKEFSTTFNTGSYTSWTTLHYDYDTASQGPIYLSDMRLDEYTTQSKTFGSAYGTMPTPTRTGYTFAGWYTAASGGTQISSTTTVSTASDHTLYAHWNVNSYTLTVNPNGGNFNGSTSNTTYTQNFDTQKVLPIPTRTGYTFNGWSLSGSGKVTKYGVPKYSEPYSSMSVYNNSGNGTVTHTSIARSSDSPILSSSNMLQIKTAGTASPGLGGFYQNATSYANATFYHVIVAKIPVGYTIQHAENATGTGRTITWLTPQAGTGKFETYIYRHKCGSSGTFSTFGHVYLSGTAATSSSPVTWYVAYANIFDATSSTPNNAGQVFRYGAGATTLTANWTANKYTVTLNQQSGSGGTSSVTATYNAAMPSITKPTRTGYTFGGYYTAANGGGTQYYTAAGASARAWNLTSNTTLYAKWTANNYTVKVTPKVDGTTYASGGAYNNGYFTFNVYKAGTLVSSGANTYSASIPYGTSVRVVAVAHNGFRITANGDVTATVGTSGLTFTPTWTHSTASITYRSAVMGSGAYQSSVTGPALSGTTGQSKTIDQFQVTGFTISNSTTSGSVNWRLHQQDRGDMPSSSSYYVYPGTAVDTGGKRIEGLTMKLTGDASNYFDIYYRVHVQDQGWLNWTSDNAFTGSQGLCKRVEAVKVKVVPKGTNVTLNECGSGETCKDVSVITSDTASNCPVDNGSGGNSGGGGSSSCTKTSYKSYSASVNGPNNAASNCTTYAKKHLHTAYGVKGTYSSSSITYCSSGYCTCQWKEKYTYKSSC